MVLTEQMPLQLTFQEHKDKNEQAFKMENEMTPTEREEFRQMATDIALLKQSQSKIVEPALVRINRKLDTLNFYTKKEVDDKIADARSDIEKQLVSVQKRRWYENTISATFGALLTGVAMFIVNEIIGGK